jgi:hypothetical protein
MNTGLLRNSDRGITVQRQSGNGGVFLGIYLCILLVLTFYQDFPLVNMIGEIGRSPIIVLFPLFIFCEIAQLSKHKRITNTSKVQKHMTWLILYLSIVSMAYVLIQFMQGNYSFVGVNLLSKSIKVLTYFIVILLYIRHMALIFSKITSLKVLYGAFMSAFTILVVIMIVEIATMPDALTFLHSRSGSYWRVRLLTSESSTTGSIVVVYSAILVYLSRYLSSGAKTLSLIYVGVFFFYYLFETGSKGFLIVSMLTLVVTMMRFLDFRKKRNFILLISAVLAMYLFVAYFSSGLISSFSNDIENYTSSYTRMGTIIIAIVTVAHHPLGVGTGAYLIYFDQYLTDAINFMSRFYYNTFGISQINTGELLRYTESDKNLGVKSGFFQWVMFGGIYCVIFFYLVSKDLILKVKNSFILFLALVFTLFSLLFIALEIKYEVWLLFAFISSFFGEKKIETLLPGEESK